MKNLNLLNVLMIMCLIISCGKPQKSSTENRLGYLPEKTEDVTQENFDKYIDHLSEIYKKYNSAEEMSFSDNVKILQSLTYLKAPKDKVLNQLSIIENIDMNKAATLIPMMFTKKSFENYFTPEEYDKLIEKYALITAIDKNTDKEFDLEKYAKDGGYDYGLVALMQKVLDDDSKSEGVYKRGENESPERIAVDQRNSYIMDSLYSSYGQYIGKSLVGDRYASIMGVVMIHSDKEHMEKYLPIIHEAVNKDEVNSNLLKGLIDVYYDVYHGYQVFGGRNAKLADEETRAKIKAKYGLK